MARPRTALLALAALALVAAGCGGGQVTAQEVPGAPPPLTVPTDTQLGSGGSNADAGADQSGNSADSSGSADSGTAGTGSAVSGTAQAPADSGAAAPTPAPTAAPDDTTGGSAPPPGSAPEQFENFCEQNAGAC